MYGIGHVDQCTKDLELSSNSGATCVRGYFLDDGNEDLLLKTAAIALGPRAMVWC